MANDDIAIKSPIIAGVSKTFPNGTVGTTTGEFYNTETGRCIVVLKDAQRWVIDEEYWRAL